MNKYLSFIVFFLSSCAASSGDIFPPVNVDEEYLKKIVHNLSVNIGPRNYDHYESLNLASEYIQGEFEKLNYKVNLCSGDGSLGWRDYAPYDRIIVTAAAPFISPFWLEQLKVGGRIVVPLGSEYHQELTVVKKIAPKQIEQREVCGCVFVPLIGEFGYEE